jgi:hypothetical protein
MKDVVAPQQVVANADYPYYERVAHARELLARMGIRDVKPLYAAAPAAQRHANEPAAEETAGATEEPTFDSYWAGWALRDAQPSVLVAGNDHDGGR